VTTSILGSAQIGDRVVLVSEDLAAGEWVIVGIAEASEVQSEADIRALEAMTGAEHRPGKDVQWLHLRRQEQMTAAAPAPSALYNSSLRGKLIGDNRYLEAWKQSEKVPLEDALATIAKARRAEYREVVPGLVELEWRSPA
jgi:hypothetical protein